MFAIKSLSSVCAVVALTACGGGGDSGADVAKNKWAANNGIYSGCDAHEKTTVQFSALGSNQATLTFRDDFYDAVDCKGMLVGTRTYPLPVTVAYMSTGFSNVSGIGAGVQSVSIDRAQISMPAMTRTLTGSGVQGLCVNYANGGKTCTSSLSVPAATFDGGFYFNGNTFITLTLKGTGYITESPVLTKQ